MEGGEDEGSDDNLVVQQWLAQHQASGLTKVLVVWVLAWYRVLVLTKVLIPAM
jgi:hypothetical protein